MKIPLSWLKEYAPVSVPTAKLAEDLTMVGLAVDGVEEHEGDAVLDLDVTTNRVDCMNVYGVAREVATLYALPLQPIEIGTPQDAGEPGLRVTIEAPELCPRFCARVLDVKMGPSPSWLRERLEKVGVRPISNVVDLTNYVMMEMGHPSHAFDLDLVPGRHLNVRWASEGERLTTLDGVERSLHRRVGVVAGPEGALALAGVMGGATSEVGDATRAVALEAAYWDPLSIRRAAKSLGMHTEASHRFERGADPMAPPTATARIAYLLEKIGAGRARPGLIDVVPTALARRRVVLRPARVSAVLGVDVPRETSRATLERLGFEVGDEHGELRTIVPSWRGDVSREADLVEEVGRHLGLNRIPSTIPPATRGPGLTRAQRREAEARELLVGAGLTEVMTHTLVPASAGGRAVPHEVRLQNPLTEEQSVLRGSLLEPGLLGALAANLRQGRRDVAIFEIGRVFGAGQPLPAESRRLGVLLAGQLGAHWSGKPRPVDVYDVKGILEALFRRLGLDAVHVEPGGTPDLLHPGQSGRVKLVDRTVGSMGAIHPDVAQAKDLRDGAVAAEIDLDALLGAEAPPVRTTSLPRTPPVARDLSLLLDATLAARRIETLAREAAGASLVGLRIADRYDGPPVPAGKVSLMVSLTFQDPARTLTGEEVQSAVDRVRSALHAQGIEVRGE